MKEFEVYENNDGNLVLFILQEGKPVECIKGFEWEGRGALVKAIKDIENYVSWDGQLTALLAFESTGEGSIEEMYDEMRHCRETKLIADDTYVYVANLGIAGEYAFSMAREFYTEEKIPLLRVL